MACSKWRANINAENKLRLLCLLSELHDTNRYTLWAECGVLQINLACCFGRGENWSLACRKEHKLRVLENRVRRKPFWPKRVEVGRGWRRFIVCAAHRMFCGWSNQGHVAVWGREALVGELEGKEHLEYLDIDGSTML